MRIMCTKMCRRLWFPFGSVAVVVAVATVALVLIAEQAHLAALLGPSIRRLNRVDEADAAHQAQGHNATWLSDRQSSSRDFPMASEIWRSALRLQEKPPLWYVMFGNSVKNLAMLVLFGPPKVDKDAAWWKTMLSLAFMLSSLTVAMSDVRNIVSVMNFDGLTTWERINGMAFAVSMSSNIQTWMTMTGIDMLHRNTVSWRLANDDSYGMDWRDHVDKQTSALLVQSQGWLWCQYLKAMNIVYNPVVVLGLIYLSVGIIAYVWLVTIGVFVGGGILIFVPGMMLVERLGGVEGGSLATGSSNRDALIATDGCQTVLDKLGESILAKDFDKQVAYANATGSPYGAWSEYFMGAAFGQAVLLAPVILRFYVGTGYKQSMIDTYEDRHVQTFVTSLMSTALASLESAQHYATVMDWQNASGALGLFIRWMLAVSYYI